MAEAPKVQKEKKIPQVFYIEIMSKKKVYLKK